MDCRPIGVFDSGMGGISVLAKAIEELPYESFFYFGDNAFAPYGLKSRDEILSRCLYIVDYFLNEGCKAILIACNTATSVAVKELRARYSLPIIGMEPALKLAAEKQPEGQIAVLATPLTLRLEKFQNLMSSYGEHAIPVPCPLLVEYIEHFEVDTSLVKNYVREQLLAHNVTHPSSIVLGCTHFSFVRRLLQEEYPHTDFVDGTLGTINQLRRKIANMTTAQDAKSTIKLFSSSEDPETLQNMKRLLQAAKQNKDYYQI